MLWQIALDELKRARAKRAEWDAKVKALEKKCAEMEKTCIHDMMIAADLTPEQLANLIAYSKDNLPGDKPVEEIVNANNGKESDFMKKRKKAEKER